MNPWRRLLTRGCTCARAAFCAAAACLLLGFCPQSAPAQQAPPKPAASAPGPQDPAELEAFVDGVMAAHKEAHHISGATIAVVLDGRLFFAKGYGYADVGKKKRVDAEKTLFRIGSVSKLFTWTAVMQLVEQGKLDLNADLNTYLTRFKIPATYPQPITMAHLMAHTPGFEDNVIGLFARSPERLIRLSDLLAAEMPARVRPPGQLASYSNYGTALAGYIVELISGLPWEEYVEKNIFQPLDMKHTTVRQPIPGPLASDLATGYQYADGQFKEKEFEFIPLRPAGSMSAAAADMAHFMMAHLQNGRYGSSTILSEATARRMHSPLFTHASQLNGMLHGFYEMSRNGQRAFGHGGDTLWFHTALVLLPERRLGLFVSYNSDTGPKAREQLIKAFFERYYPAPDSPRPRAAADSGQLVRRFEGSYSAIRISHTTLTKLSRLMGAIRVSATDDGLLITRAPGSEPKRWAQVEPLVFREVDGSDLLAFREDAGGRVTHLFLGGFPPIAFVRLSPTETARFHLAVVGLCGLIFLSALVLWPIGAIRGWRRGARAPALARLSRAAAWAVSALGVVFLIATASVLANPFEIVFGVPPLLRALLALPLVAAVLMVAVAAFTVLAWTKRFWSVAGRVHYSLVTLAGLVFLVWLNYWNLLGYHFG